ncbi:MAG: alpha/beta hydrolase [Proteobacteria bacterium]|nr:alpha/beta hydrolase [Pseudomonadota bacterium]
MKKILTWIIGILVVLCLIVVLLVNSWADTGHGKLNYKIAIIFKLGELTGSESEVKADRPPIAEIRKEMVKAMKGVSGEPTQLPKIINRTFPGPTKDIPIRIYIPIENKVLPIVLFFHGGGWIKGDLDTCDNLVRYLAFSSGNIVVSVDYRLAPENPFPAGLEDSYSALEWVAANAGTFNGDPTKIAVAGDSAGGNLSAVLTLLARDRNGPKISRQILLYPSTNLSNLDTESYRHFGKGFNLDKTEIEWLIGQYLTDEKDIINPLASPLLAANHGNLPPATIITAQMDPLRDEGKQYAEKLKKAGVEVQYRCYDGMIHAFVSADGILSQAFEALDEVGADLKKTY